MKLVNGTYTRVSWEQAINEIGDQMLKIREESGPDSVYWLVCEQTTSSHICIVSFCLLGHEQR